MALPAAALSRRLASLRASGPGGGRRSGRPGGGAAAGQGRVIRCSCGRPPTGWVAGWPPTPYPDRDRRPTRRRRTGGDRLPGSLARPVPQERSHPGRGAGPYRSRAGGRRAGPVRVRRRHRFDLPHRPRRAVRRPAVALRPRGGRALARHVGLAGRRLAGGAAPRAGGRAHRPRPAHREPSARCSEPRLTVADLADRMGHPALRRHDAGQRVPPGRGARTDPGLGGRATVGRAPLRAVDGDRGRPRPETADRSDLDAGRGADRAADGPQGRRSARPPGDPTWLDGSDGIEIRTVDGTECPRRCRRDLHRGSVAAAGLLPGSALRQMRRNLRRLEPALAPRVCHRLTDQRDRGGRRDGTARPTTASRPSRYRRPVADGTLESVHDFTAAQPDRSAGVRWRGFRSWFRRPPVSTERARAVLRRPPHRRPATDFPRPSWPELWPRTPRTIGTLKRRVRACCQPEIDERSLPASATVTLRCPFSGPTKDLPS